MLDKVEPKLPLWRSSAEQTDSGSESHPLMSSDASHRSFGATACMFPDSETSDLEAAPMREPPPLPPRSARPSQLPAARRPFLGQNAHNQLADATYNRFQYYNKLRSFAPYEDSALTIPGHIAPLPSFVPYAAGKMKESGKQGSLVTIFSIWNTIMGSSLLVMPWGIERAGFFTGIFLMVLVGAICLYTAYLLLEVQKVHGNGNVDGEVSDLCSVLLGQYVEVLAKFFSLVVLLGASIVYWVLMSNFLYHSVEFIYEATTHTTAPDLYNFTGYVPALCPRIENFTTAITKQVKDTESSFYKVWNLHTTVPLFLILVISPLINFKSATFFTKFNALGTFSVFYLLIFVFTKAIFWGINVNFVDEYHPTYAPGYLPSFPALSGMLALSFFIHNIIISITRNNIHQENNVRDLSIAYILVTITYTFIGVVFYISFPIDKACISDNMLNNFLSSDLMTLVARVCLFFQLVTVFPLISYMLRVQVLTILTKMTYPGLSHVVLFNASIIFVCVIFAVFLPRIGTIIRFTGALSGFIYIFTLPILLYMASMRLQGKLTWLSVILHLLIPVVGGANLLAQFFVSDH